MYEGIVDGLRMGMQAILIIFVDLHAQVPDVVGHILAEVSSAAGGSPVASVR